MPDSKIMLKIGQIEFSSEGNQEWVGKQLDKILDKAGDLLNLAPPLPADPNGGQHQPPGTDSVIGKKTLPAFLKEKGANTVQVTKFLATAVWLEAKGKTRLKTGDVTNALRESNQTKLNNAADCLNQNVTKGYCEKDGNEFFVTEDGKDSL